MFLTFSWCFHKGKAEWLKIRTFNMGPKDIYRGCLKKGISQKSDLKNIFFVFILSLLSSFHPVCWSFFFKFFIIIENFLRWKKSIRNNDLQVSTTTYPSVTKYKWVDELQTFPFLEVHNHWMAKTMRAVSKQVELPSLICSDLRWSRVSQTSCIWKIYLQIWYRKNVPT